MSADDRKGGGSGGRRTPPGGVRVPLFVEEEEDKTPVTADPFVRLEHHQKKFEGSQTLALGEIKALHAKLDATVNKHDEAQARDEREHRRLNDSINKIVQHNAGMQAKLDIHAEKLDTAMEKIDNSIVSQASVTGQLTMALEDLRAIKRIDEHEKKVTVETMAMVKRTETDAEATVVKSRAETEAAVIRARLVRNRQILQIVGASLGSGGLITLVILTLLGKC